MRASPRRLRVVLVRPRNPQNIGACARAMANFGFDDLAVVDPYPPVWRETRAAPEAETVVLRARRFGSIEAACRGYPVRLGASSFHRRPAEQAVLSLPELAAYLASLPRASPVALLLGPERSGLSNAELAACRRVIRIPTDPRTPSMNLAQALAVLLYEWRRPPPEEQTPAAADLEPLIRTWIELARRVGYPPGYTEAARAGRFRQAMSGLSADAPALRLSLSFSRWLLKAVRRL